jgi:alpha-mannosidase
MSRPVLHLICQAHLDPVWLWQERNGIAEILTTMQSAVDRAWEYPQFKFTRSSAAVYRWAEEMDPGLFRSIQDLVEAGRWEVVGGMIEQPDCNLPSAESFVRQEAAFMDLPVVDHELQFVFRGCYSATGETKQQHRKAQNLLFAAESLACQAGKPATPKLEEAWWQLATLRLFGAGVHQVSPLP